MDTVRFGRALGTGARQAAKTLLEAADAATATTPEDVRRARGTAAGTAVRERVGQVVEAQRGVRRGGKRFGEAVWAPLVKVSGVLWLEVTGVFFGLFLLVAGMSVWKLRGAWRDTGANHGQHVQLLWSLVMLGVFGYFCVSSFVRAGKRERR